MKKNGCAITLVAFVGIALALAVYLAMTGVTSSGGDQVTLRATDGNRAVQMFDSVGVNATAMKQFPGGTDCTRISGPTTVTVAGVSMRFYKLACDGTMGYVNAQYVR